MALSWQACGTQDTPQLCPSNVTNLRCSDDTLANKGVTMMTHSAIQTLTLLL